MDFADYVSQYAAALEIEVTPDLIAESIQGLLLEHIRGQFETRAKHLLLTNQYQVDVCIHTDPRLTVSAVMPEELLPPVALVDEWHPFLKVFVDDVIVPAIRREMQPPRMHHLERLDIEQIYTLGDYRPICVPASGDAATWED